MRRRPLLAALGTAVAGCTGPGQSSSLEMERPTARLDLSPTTDEELPHRVLYSVRNPDSEEASFLESVAETGTGTLETPYDRPLPVDRAVAGPEYVWRFAADVVDRVPSTSYGVTVDIVQGTVVAADAVAFADLPAVDREKFAAAGLADGDPVGIGTGFLYTHDERERSVLVPDPAYDYIVWENGARAEWSVDDGHETTLKTYRYTAESHTPLSEYGARMRERFAFGLTDLSSDERAIAEAATADGGYVVDAEATPSPAFDSLVDRFRDHPRARPLGEATPTDGGDVSGHYVVQYDGRLYWVRVALTAELVGTTTEMERETRGTEP